MLPRSVDVELELDLSSCTANPLALGLCEFVDRASNEVRVFDLGHNRSVF